MSGIFFPSRFKLAWGITVSNGDIQGISSVLHMRTLNDFLSIPIVRSFDVPCVNGPYVFEPVPKNFPDLVRRATRTGKTYGPFTHGTSKLLTIGMLRKSFKVRICKTLPKKACLEYHIGNCDAPCEFESAGKKYAGHMAELQNVLSDGKGMVRYERTLEKMMREASNDSRFEDAIEIRETLRRLQSLKGRQNMERSSSVRDEDYVGILTVGDDAHVMSMRQSNGIIRDRERFSYEEIADNTFSNFLYQYYTTRKVPSIILTNKAPERKITLEKMLSKQSGRAVLIKTPGRGRQRQIMDLVMRNIHIAVSGGVEPAIEEMKKQLRLDTMPHIIECFDISNHGADYAVGSMSRFVDGRPDKSGYIKFMINGRPGCCRVTKGRNWTYNKIRKHTLWYVCSRM